MGVCVHFTIKEFAILEFLVLRQKPLQAQTPLAIGNGSEGCARERQQPE